MTALTKPQIRALIEFYNGRGDLAPIKDITIAVLTREGMVTDVPHMILGLTELGHITAQKLAGRYDIDVDGAVTPKETTL